jgi:hypothetical protein
MKHCLIAAIGSASIVAAADAGFAGLVAYSRNVGGNTVIDVFAAVTNPADKFMNAYNVQSNGIFVQKAGLDTKTWKPDSANLGSSRSTADDSFMTSGTAGGAISGGQYYATGLTSGDGTFVGGANGSAWNATADSPAATTIPNNGGWYTSHPPTGDNKAELMSTWAGSLARADSVLVSAASGYQAPADSASATYGVWISHLVVAGTDRVIGVDFTFQASVTTARILDGSTTTQATYRFVPAPGAGAVAGALALLAHRRRRA